MQATSQTDEHQSGLLSTRLTGACGIVFAILGTAALMMFGGEPDLSDGNAKLNSFYSSAHNRTGLIIGLYLAILAAIAFIAFASGLVSRLRQAGGNDALATLALLCGVIFAAALALFGAIAATPAAAIAFGGTPVPDPTISGILPQLADVVLSVIAALALIGALWTIGVLVLRTGALPRWFAWFSFIVGLILFASPEFVPLLLIPIWALVTGIVLLRGVPSAAGAGASSARPSLGRA